MRILKILASIIIGFVAVIWIFTTFIVKDQHVLITQDVNGTIQFMVDDGATLDTPESCVLHCMTRHKWNIRNTVRISATKTANTNDMQHLADLMCYNHIYPTTLEIDGENAHQYRPGSYYNSFSSKHRIKK